MKNPSNDGVAFIKLKRFRELTGLSQNYTWQLITKNKIRVSRPGSHLVLVDLNSYHKFCEQFTLESFKPSQAFVKRNIHGKSDRP
jgi:hypothetical protein